MSTIPMRAFGKHWTQISYSEFEDLMSLEREGSIYTDHWQEQLDDFRHVRIRFTQEEVKEYVRSYWAYELFLQAGSPGRALDLPEIPEDIARRADEYTVSTIEGETLGPFYHCPAAFLSPELEALVCSNARSEIIEEFGKEALLSTLQRAIDSLTPSIRLFNNREKSLSPWLIQCEDDVRDLLYAILRAAISDIMREEPVPSKVGIYSKVDLFSKLARLFVEVKWIDRKGTWKQIVKQINDDIQSYITHPACETLIFVVIDAVKDIPDPNQFEKDLSCNQKIGEKSVEIMAFVREP